MARLIAVLGVVALLASGCFGSNTPSRADVRAARRALQAIVPSDLKPAMIGTKHCTLVAGLAHRVAATCETSVRRENGKRVVKFTESWQARDFRASGGSFRQPGTRKRLQTSWQVTVSDAGTVGDAKV